MRRSAQLVVPGAHVRNKAGHLAAMTPEPVLPLMDSATFDNL
ncbi:MAG: hypothetical protein AAFQ09_09255 [Pseudomonadota bacterium]